MNPRPVWLRELHRDPGVRVAMKIEHGGNCWRWTGTRQSGGYGEISIDKQKGLVHRMMYRRHHGEIAEGMVVRHRCDNRRCVNPGHLEIGTHQDNVNDAVERGGVHFGDRTWSAKINNAQAIEIARTLIDGVPASEVARRFGISRTRVCQIGNGQHWGRVTGDVRSRYRQTTLRRQLLAFAKEDPAAVRMLLREVEAVLDEDDGERVPLEHAPGVQP